MTVIAGQVLWSKKSDIHFLITSGYVVQGSNGEYAYMRPEEKIEMVRIVRQLAPQGKLVLAGSGCEGWLICCEQNG